MRAEHLAPAAGAAIACAFLALVLMLQRQMARQEQVLREILRMHRELLDSQLESNRLLKRRQSLTGWKRIGKPLLRTPLLRRRLDLPCPVGQRKKCMHAFMRARKDSRMHSCVRKDACMMRRITCASRQEQGTYQIRVFKIIQALFF